MSRLKDVWKRVRRRLMVLAGPPVSALALWSLSLTWRFTGVYSEELENVWRSRRGVLYLFWHGDMLPAAPFFRRYHPRSLSVLISTHRDGEFITRTARYFGVGSVRGSERRGGGQAMSAMVAALAQGRDILITPDGPRGPAHEIKRGVIDLARRTRAPICPVGIAAHPAWRASSWDRFQAPWPGARVAIVLGAPLEIPDMPSPRDRAAFRELVQKHMADVNRRAEHLAQNPAACASDASAHVEPAE